MSSHSMISIYDQLSLPVAEKEIESDHAEHSSKHRTSPPTLGIILSLNNQNGSSNKQN